MKLLDPYAPFTKIPFLETKFQEAASPRALHPELDVKAPIDAIIRTFFKYDIVLIRNFIPKMRAENFLKNHIEPIYRQDDIKIAAGYKPTADESEMRQLKCGWIADDRLTPYTDGAVCLEDALISNTYTRLCDRIMGTTSWRKHHSSYTRRVHPKLDNDRGYRSPADMHVNALLLPDDYFTLGFFLALTECGKNSPGLQFILASEAEMKKHARYDPSLPFQTTGDFETNARLSAGQFKPEVYDAAFGPERRWNPELNPGDVLVMSSWTAFKTHYPPNAQNEAIWLEQNIIINRPDSPIREQNTL